MRTPTPIVLAVLGLCLLSTADAQPAFDLTKRITYDPATHTFEWPWLGGPPVRDINALSSPYWEFFWIFGDGHYKMVSGTNKVQHTYEQAGDHEVKVVATPYYSTEDTKRATFTVTIDPAETGPSRMAYDSVFKDTSDLLLLDLSGDGILTSQNSRGHLALHYRFQFPPCVDRNFRNPKSEGYIIVFYNEVNNKWDDLELQHLPDRRVSDDSGPTLRQAELLLEGNNIKAKTKAAERLTALQRKYEHSIIRRAPIGYNQKEVIGRFFYEFEPGPHLEQLLKSNDKQEYHVDITAVLVSSACPKKKDVPWKEEFFFSEKPTSLKVEEMRDPNGISVRPAKAVINRDVRELTYLVTFKNNKDGKAKDVFLKMPLQDARALDVRDTSDIEVVRREPSEKICPACREGDIEDFKPCFEKQLKPGVLGDTILFIFHNINLRGRKKDSLSLGEPTPIYYSSDGEVQFKLKVGNTLEDFTRVPAIIQFHEATPLITGPAQTEWEIRRQSLVLGGNLANSSMCELDYRPNNFLGRLSYGFSYEKLPVHNGSGWGIQASINTNRFSASAVSQGTGGLSPDSLLEMTTETQLRLTNLDLQWRWIFRERGGALFGNQAYFNYGAGIGLVVPLSGYLRGDSRLASSDTLFLDQLAGSSEVRLGLFSSSSNTLFNRRYSSQNSLGLLSTIFGEVELSNNFSLGAEVSNRLYPWLINNTTFSDFRVQVYIKWFLKNDLLWQWKK